MSFKAKTTSLHYGLIRGDNSNNDLEEHIYFDKWEEHILLLSYLSLTQRNLIYVEVCSVRYEKSIATKF